MDPFPLSLLIVEDDIPYAEGLKNRLEVEGYRVVIASAGAEALTEIRRDRFDLVLLDVMLPGMDGHQVCRAIKTEASPEFLPVIMVSARGAEEDRLHGLAEGADDYIPKPFSIRELLARIEALLRIKKAEDALRKQNRHLEALTAIAATVSQSLDLRNILERALEKVMESLEASRGVIHLLDKDQKELVYVTSRGLPESSLCEILAIPIGQGIAGQAAEKGEPLWETEPLTHGLFPSPLDGEGRRCPAAAIPFISRGVVVGTLSLLVPASTVFTTEDLRFLSSVGRQIGLAVENARLYQHTDRELVRRVRDLSILNRVAEVTSRSFSEKEILDETLDTVMTFLTAQVGGIRLLEETSQDLILAATRGHSPTHAEKKRRIALGEDIPGRVALTGIPFSASPYSPPDPPRSPEEPISRARVTVPLKAREKILGTLCLGSDREGAFTPEDVSLLTSIGRQVGISLENARLYHKTREKALQLEALFETTQLLASSYRLEDALTLLARKGTEILRGVRAEIAVFDEENHTVALRVASEGVPPSSSPPLIVLHTPIQIREKESGVFSIFYNAPLPLEREEVELRETLARLAALAIEDTRLMTRSALLQEVHHRVKNNLQTVASLLQLQLSHQRSPGVEHAIQESIGRIKSIAVVHDLLSIQGNGQTHLRNLLLRVSHLSAGEGKASEQTHIVVRGPEISLPDREATPLALAVNELVTNAVVHGLAGRRGEIEIALSNTPSTLCVEVRDTGRGLPQGFSLSTHAHLGLRIVEALVTRELGGQVTFDTTAGTVVRVEFPLVDRGG